MKKRNILIVLVSISILGLLSGATYFLKGKFGFSADENNNSYNFAPTTMSLESVVGDENQQIVTTTGAVYTISHTSIEMVRRIDPKTNSYNPRTVARITFSNDIGPLVDQTNDQPKAVIDSTLATIEVNADSYFFITAKGDFTYTFKNLVSDAQYNKGDSLDHIWTDGYGGSLHARIAPVESSPVSSSIDTDTNVVEMKNGYVMSQMVFPAKAFDFESLYGANARPFVNFIYSPSSLATVSQNLAKYQNDGFGVFMLWPQNFYEWTEESQKYHVPHVLNSGVLGYTIDPSQETAVRDFVQLAHDNGFKVITYAYALGTSSWDYPSGHPQAGQHQPNSTTLQWMRQFQTDYSFDGWYLDGGANTGSLLENYNFIKQLRSDVGDQGIIYCHDSVDAWDNNSNRTDSTHLKYSGLRAIMLDDYVNYTLVGETGEIAQIESPSDEYLRYFSSGYGLSQSYGGNTQLTAGKSALPDSIIYRILSENLNGVVRTRTTNWLDYFKPSYDKRRAEYLSGNFNPDVNWPIAEDSSWIKSPQDLDIVMSSDLSSATLNWRTSEESGGDVVLSDNDNGLWTTPAFSASFGDRTFNVPCKTISFYAKPDGNISKTTGIFSAQTANYYVGFAATNKMIFSYLNSDGVQKTFFVPGVIADEWHLYTYSFSVSGENVTLSAYRDGSLLGSRTDTEGMSTNFGGDYIIGSFSTLSPNYLGSLDEIKFWDHAVADPEETAESYYSFNENTGTSLADSGSSNNPATAHDTAWDTGDSCYSGSCLRFDGNSSYISIDNYKKSINHSVVFNGLNPSKTYKYRIISDNRSTGVNKNYWYDVGQLVNVTHEPTSFLSSLNLTDNQVITTNPYIITAQVKDTSLVSKVEFYVDDNLIGTSTLPDVEGNYSCAWDTSKYHSLVKIIVYGSDGTTEEVTRNTSVQLDNGDEPRDGSDIVPVLPKTGEAAGILQRLKRVIGKYIKAI